MAGDLVIEEGDLEVLRDRTRDLSSRAQSVTVATAGDYISSAVGGSPLAGQGRSAGETIDEAVIALTRELDDFSQSVNDSINAYNATENKAAVSFQHTDHGGPAMTISDLLRMREDSSGNLGGHSELEAQLRGGGRGPHRGRGARGA